MVVVSGSPKFGGIGGIVHPPIGIPLIYHLYIAFWGVICYLPSFRGTISTTIERSFPFGFRPIFRGKLLNFLRVITCNHGLLKHHETNSSPMKTPMFPCKYHQNGGFSMAMLVLGRVYINVPDEWWDFNTF